MKVEISLAAACTKRTLRFFTLYRVFDSSGSDPPVDVNTNTPNPPGVNVAGTYIWVVLGPDPSIDKCLLAMLKVELTLYVPAGNYTVPSTAEAAGMAA